MKCNVFKEWIVRPCLTRQSRQEDEDECRESINNPVNMHDI